MEANLGAVISSVVTVANAARTSQSVGDALGAIEPDAIAAFFHSSLTATGIEPLVTGLPASPGAANGMIVCSAEQAVQMSARGESVILVRPETTPDDVLGMQAARGILTARGGVVSHAAIVARGWGIPAVVGAAGIRVESDAVWFGTTRLRPGNEITIDGTTGKVYEGSLATAGVKPPDELERLLTWADTVARGHVQVRANADTANDADQARRLGAGGIGLCRTEHMFLASDRLAMIRRFVLTDDPDVEASALAELEVVQTADFAAILAAMDGLPVTVRLLDPPLHEFLPDLLELTIREARGEASPTERTELLAVRRLRESNPMIGTRGVRLGVLRSGLYEMQVRALCAAVLKLRQIGQSPQVEIMIPLVVDAEELRIARGWVTGVLEEMGHPELAAEVVSVGAMIETPRAALTAADLADFADFFSFGTNDLTQLTYAFSRDDVEASLLPTYLARGILATNPFSVLDQAAVGALIRIACESARSVKPFIKLGVCGEHAGDPSSIEFLVGLGIDSLSCSPFRIPVARLAVSQALLRSGRVRIDQLAFDFDVDPKLDVAGPAVSPESELPSIQVDEAAMLHVLRIRGFVTPAGLVASLGIYPADLLAGLVSAGLVRHIQERDLFGLLPIGRQRQQDLLNQYAPEDLKARLRPTYEQFLVLNSSFKHLCNDWQLRNDVPNDHSDIAYDRGCIERLNELENRVRPVIEAMAKELPRFVRYLYRLQMAVEAVTEGDTDRFTGVMRESFHDIWMELHEDLIVLQRINRSEEGSY